MLNTLTRLLQINEIPLRVLLFIHIHSRLSAVYIVFCAHYNMQQMLSLHGITFDLLLIRSRKIFSTEKHLNFIFSLVI